MDVTNLAAKSSEAEGSGVEVGDLAKIYMLQRIRHRKVRRAPLANICDLAFINPGEIERGGMVGKAGVVDVFVTQYEKWSERETTIDEALDLVKNKGFSMLGALRVNDKLIAVVSTPIEAATYMLNQRADNGLEWHIDRALDASAEYHSLRELMPQDEPKAISTYQGRFSQRDWKMADEAIKVTSPHRVVRAKC